MLKIPLTQHDILAMNTIYRLFQNKSGAKINIELLKFFYLINNAFMSLFLLYIIYCMVKNALIFIKKNFHYFS